MKLRSPWSEEKIHEYQKTDHSESGLHAILFSDSLSRPPRWFARGVSPTIGHIMKSPIEVHAFWNSFSTTSCSLSPGGFSWPFWSPHREDGTGNKETYRTKLLTACLFMGLGYLFPRPKRCRRGLRKRMFVALIAPQFRRGRIW
jgi:hypothetical protein